jgi:hypothetical protein
MNVGLPFLEQIQQGPVNQLGGWVAKSLNQLIAAITRGYHTQHNENDTHKTITATGSISERARTTALGEWIAVPYVSTNYTATTGTWIVTASQAVSVWYTLVGKTMTVSFLITGSSLTLATATWLQIKIPAMATSTRQQWGTFAYNDNGTQGTGVCYVIPTTNTVIRFGKTLTGSSAWTVSATLSLAGSFAFEVSGV